MTCFKGAQPLSIIPHLYLFFQANLDENLRHMGTACHGTGNSEFKKKKKSIMK
jgi:hypothetical protein